MLEPKKDAKEIKKELDKMDEKVRKQYIHNISRWFNATRDILRTMNAKIVTIEMSFHDEVIPEELFIEKTTHLAWELKTLIMYLEEKFLATKNPEDEIVDGMLMTWDYNRKGKHWETKEETEDGNLIVAHTLDENHLNEMMRRIFDGFIAKIEAEQTKFHLRYRILQEEQDLIPRGYK